MHYNTGGRFNYDLNSDTYADSDAYSFTIGHTNTDCYTRSYSYLDTWSGTTDNA